MIEDYCRQQFPDAARYWESNLEFDLVREDQSAEKRRLIVSEVKWKRLSEADRERILRELESKWQRCALRHRFPSVTFDVLDSRLLGNVMHKRAKRERTVRT